MKKYISNENKSHAAGKQGYNDKPQRIAFRKMVQSDGCPILIEFLISYFNLVEGKDYKIVNDPLGERKVDLGILDVEENKLVGLVEVDYFKSWNSSWPNNYKVLNRVLRKEGYYSKNNLPYINISFNVQGDCGIFTTREMEQKYSIIHPKTIEKQEQQNQKYAGIVR